MDQSAILTKLPNKASRVSRLAKEGLFVISGQVGSIVAMLVLVKVLTGYLNPTQYGALALALTLGTLICQVAFSGSMPGIFRYYSVAAERGALYDYFLASRRMMFYGTLIAMSLGVFLLCGLMFTGKTIEWSFVVAITVGFSILVSYNSILSMVQNAARQREIVALHGALEPWLRVLFVMLLSLLVVKASVLWVVVCYLLALLIVLSSQLLFIRRLIPMKSDTAHDPTYRWTSQIWIYSKPYVMFNLFTWLSSSSDRWALATFATTEDVGLYTVLMQLGYTPISVATGLVMTFMSPIIFQRSGQATDSVRLASAKRLIWRLTWSALGLTVFGFLAALLLHETIFRFFVDEKYRLISYLLPWMVLAGGLFATGQILTEKLLSDLNSKALVIPKIISSMIGVLLNIIGVYFAGLSGAIFALIGYSTLYMLWIAWVGNKKKS